MDIIIEFFRDTLDGQLYIITTVISTILIMACIGYLGEKYLIKKKNIEFAKKTYATVENSSVAQNNTNNK